MRAEAFNPDLHVCLMVNRHTGEIRLVRECYAAWHHEKGWRVFARESDLFSGEIVYLHLQSNPRRWRRDDDDGA